MAPYAAFTPAQLVAGNKHYVARSKLLVTRNKLRWCKRGIRRHKLHSVLYGALEVIEEVTINADNAVTDFKCTVNNYKAISKKDCACMLNTVGLLLYSSEQKCLHMAVLKLSMQGRRRRKNMSHNNYVILLIMYTVTD